MSSGLYKPVNEVFVRSVTMATLWTSQFQLACNELEVRNCQTSERRGIMWMKLALKK